MKKFRTAFMLLGSLALASTLLTGCSDNTTAATSPQTTTTYAQYLYNVNSVGAPATVTSFVQHLDTGSVSATSVPNVNAGNGGRSIAVTPNGLFAYVNNNGANTVSQYLVSPSLGTLTAMATPSVAVGGTGFPVGGAVHPSGLRYYTCNNGDISVFSINQTTGALTLASNTVATALGTPQQITFDASGVYAYVTGATGIYCFTVDATSGALAAVPANNFNTGLAMGGIVIDNAKHLYATAGTNQILGFSIGSTGLLTSVGVLPTLPVGSFVGTPAGLTFEPNHAALYVAEPAVSAIGAFAVSPATGLLTAVTGAAAGLNANAVAADPTGSYLYCTNFSTNSIGAYVIGTGGALSLVSGQPFATGVPPTATGPIALKLVQFVSYVVQQ